MDSFIALIADPNAGSVDTNIEEGALTKRSFFARVQALGKNEGLGDNSRPGLFVTTCEAALKRVIGVDDCDDIFDRYSKSVAATQGVGWKPQASQKQQVSKLRVAIKLGLLTQVNGLELLNKVIAAQKAQRAANEGKNDFPPFDGLVKVSRFQLKAPDSMLPDEVISGLLIKGAADLPEEADRLEKIVKAIENLAGAKEDPVSEESIDALTEAGSALMTRIRELGGSTAMRKAAQKAEEQAAKAQADTKGLIDRHHAMVARLSPAPALVAAE